MALLVVWLLVYMSVIGPPPVSAVTALRQGPPDDHTSKENALNHWDNEGGAQERDAVTLSKKKDLGDLGVAL
jgi:hypothetical protein